MENNQNKPFKIKKFQEERRKRKLHRNIRKYV